MTDPCAALRPLEALDPDLARRLMAACRRATNPPDADGCRKIVAVMVACCGHEINFGLAVAEGYEALLAGASPEVLADYSAAVQRDGRQGAALGRATAVYLPPVLLARMALNAVDGMLAREHAMQSALGAILNELGDVLSDTALYLPLAAAPGPAPRAGWPRNSRSAPSSRLRRFVSGLRGRCAIPAVSTVLVKKGYP